MEGSITADPWCDFPFRYRLPVDDCLPGYNIPKMLFTIRIIEGLFIAVFPAGQEIPWKNPVLGASSPRTSQAWESPAGGDLLPFRVDPPQPILVLLGKTDTRTVRGRGNHRDAFPRCRAGCRFRSRSLPDGARMRMQTKNGMIDVAGVHVCKGQDNVQSATRREKEWLK